MIQNQRFSFVISLHYPIPHTTNPTPRFPIRYYTTAEDLTNYVLKDMGITESVLNYQLAMVKTPYKGTAQSLI